MSREPSPTREERLAARLRENLQRRKAQARAVASQGASQGGEAAPDTRSSQDDAQ